MKLAGALLLLAVSACVAHAPPPPPKCALAASEFVRTELYFGLRRKEGRIIEPTTFEVFVDEYVSNELASGFTLLSAEGRYLADGKVSREPSRVLVVLHHGDATIEQAIERIRTHYKELFAQDAVLRVDAPSCARF